MKKYDIYYAGGEKITTIYSTCVSKACKSFIETLRKPAKYTIDNKELAGIRYTDNFSICSNFVVMRV